MYLGCIPAGQQMYSSHMRGCSNCPFLAEHTSRIPRVCGGEPLAWKENISLTMYSPRMRGRTVKTSDRSALRTVFPAHAGVRLGIFLFCSSGSCIPRACGGDLLFYSYLPPPYALYFPHMCVRGNAEHSNKILL